MSNDRYLRVTLSERQHQIVELALRHDYIAHLDAGDEESARENAETLSALLDTEEVTP